MRWIWKRNVAKICLNREAKKKYRRRLDCLLFLFCLGVSDIQANKIYTTRHRVYGIFFRVSFSSDRIYMENKTAD